MLERIALADASSSTLAERFGMSPTGMKKHVGILEAAGLVTTEEAGRVRTCRLGRLGSAAELAWMEQQRRLGVARFDGMDGIVGELRAAEERHAPG